MEILVKPGTPSWQVFCFNSRQWTLMRELDIFTASQWTSSAWKTTEIVMGISAVTLNTSLSTLGYYYFLPLLKWSATAIKRKRSNLVCSVSTATSLTSQWSVSFSLFRFPRHANISVTPLGQLTFCMIITVNCEFCQMLQRHWCLPFLLRNGSCVFCMCLFEQRLHTSGCLLFAKEPLSYIYSMFQ